MSEPDDIPTCPICGAEMAWEDCWKGCDDGFFDAYESDPVNFAEGEVYEVRTGLGETDRRRMESQTARRCATLALTRYKGQRIVLSGAIVIEVLEAGNGRAKLGITAPPDVQIWREELLLRETPKSRDRQQANES